MYFSRIRFTLYFLGAAICLAACGTNATPTAAAPVTPVEAAATGTVTPAPDPCAPQNIGAGVNAVNRFMRAFDDGSALASNTTRDQLRPAIAELQKIRRDAEDHPVPQCLAKLKGIQLDHMNMVINTLLGFMGGADSKVTNEGIAKARLLHDEYSLELARLLGITVVILPSPAPGTLTPVGTGTVTAPNETPTVSGPHITVPGPSTVNMRKKPSLQADSAGLLLVGDSAPAIARSTDNAWYLIQIPGRPAETAWVYASLVTLSTTADTLPVATAIP